MGSSYGSHIRKPQVENFTEQSDPVREIWNEKEHRWMSDGAFLGFLTIWRRATSQFKNLDHLFIRD